MRDSDELGEGPALGSDPFTQGDGTLPYLLRLRERTVRLVREEPDPAADPRPRSPRPARIDACRPRSRRIDERRRAAPSSSPEPPRHRTTPLAKRSPS